MKRTTLLNLVLAIALIVVSVQLIRTKQHSEPAPVNVSATVMDNILTRTSIRKFTSTPVSEGAIDTLLRAAMAAPTAVNRQPWHLVVVNDTVQLSALRNSSRRPGPLATSTLAIAVCGNMDKALEGDGQPFWIQDVSAATENLLLAAHSLGLGAVWTGVYPIKERIQQVSDILQLPENIVPLSLVVLGYPDEAPEPKNKWNEENVSWNTFGKAKE